MIDDARTVPADSVLSADLCIVGGGAAGIAIGRELAGSSLRVIVLESGGLEYETKVNDLNKGDVVGLPYFPLDTARLRYFGGSTNHWGGVCRPMEPIDFEARDWIPGSGWPITRADLDPYYPRAATVAGLEVADWNLARWSTISRFPVWPFAPADPIENVVAQVVDSDVRSFAKRFRSTIEAAANVTVHLHANAISIDTEPNSRHVERIRVATLEGNHFAVTARAYVLATGGLENARLLLASDGVAPGGVGNDHGVVGRYFAEHPRFRAGVIVPADPRLRIGFYDFQDVGEAILQGYLTLTDSAAREERLTDVQIRLNPIYDPAIEAAIDAPVVDAARDLEERVRGKRIGNAMGEIGQDLNALTADLMTWQQDVIAGGPLAVPLPDVVDEVIERAGSGNLEAAMPLVFGNLATAGYGQLAGGLPLDGIWLSTRIEQAPNPDSRVSLTDHRDALGMRQMKLDWQLTELEKHSVVRTLELLGAEIGRRGLGRLRVEVDDGGDSWPEDLAGGWHHMGTTRMHDDPTRGVVDRDCRVHGMDNLYVAGSSVFTTAGSGTPTMTLVALALRLVDHLRGQLA